ncbi:MAG: SGNH/GDSL hydrolase family protein [bacterium]
MRFLKKNVCERILLILLGFIVSFILAELILRGIESYHYKKPSKRILREFNNKIYVDERDKTYVFGHKPNVAVKMEIDSHKFSFHTNHHGLREKKDYHRLKKSIIFLGDSVIEGDLVDNEETIDEIFEKNTKAVSLNFGVGSSNTVHEYYFLKNKYQSYYNTKLIVLGFCLNDFEQNYYLRYFDPSIGNWRLYKYIDQGINSKRAAFSGIFKNLLKKSKFISLIYSFAYKNILRQEAANAPPYGYDNVSALGKLYTESYINKIKQYADNIGAGFVVAIFPQECQLSASYNNYRRMQDVLIEILVKNGIRFIDLFDIFRAGYSSEPNIRLYNDDTHPNKKGNLLAGEYLAKELIKLFPDVF